jgi:hypothetical protein
MESFEEKLRKLFEGGLADGKAELETLANGDVCGHVVSSEFKDLTYEQRRARLKQITERALDEEELLKISTLLTYTPEEWSFEPA